MEGDIFMQDVVVVGVTVVERDDVTIRTGVPFIVSKVGGASVDVVKRSSLPITDELELRVLCGVSV